MNAPCGCFPGTFENGWHEIRSAQCRAEEREQWRRLFENAPQIVENLFREFPEPVYLPDMREAARRERS